MIQGAGGDLRKELQTTGDRQAEPVSSNINWRDSRSTLRGQEVG